MAEETTVVMTTSVRELMSMMMARSVKLCS